MVLKSNIRTSASPRQQQSYWGVRVTKNEYFSLLIHAKQLLLVTFCDKTARIGPSFRTHTSMDTRTDARMDGQTHIEVEIVIKILVIFLTHTSA